MLRQHKGLIFILIASFLLRLVVMLWASGFREHPDVIRYKDWARIGYVYGLADSYSPKHLSFGTDPNDQPPGSLYVLESMYWVWIQTGKVLAHVGIAPGSSPWVNIILLHMMLRMPSILCDIAIGALIYMFVMRIKKDRRAARSASLLFLLNPIVIYNSSFWGQMDAVNNFPALVALWFLIGNYIVIACAALVVSILIKFSVSYEIPLFALVAYRRTKTKITTGITIGLVVLILIGLIIKPIFPQPYSWYLSFLSMHATGQMTNVSAFAFNFWWVIFHPTLMMGPSTDITKVVDIWLYNAPLTQTMYFGIPLSIITIAIAMTVMGSIFFWYFKQTTSENLKDRRYVTISAYAMIALLAYLLLPQMHERYIYPSIAPLAILIGLDMPLRREFLALSFLNLINLLIVWHPMPLPVWAFDIMKNSSLQWWIACFTTCTGFWTVWKITKLGKQS